jgi:hypothetical protein
MFSSLGLPSTCGLWACLAVRGAGDLCHVFNTVQPLLARGIHPPTPRDSPCLLGSSTFNAGVALAIACTSTAVPALFISGSCPSPTGIQSAARHSPHCPVQSHNQRATPATWTWSVHLNLIQACTLSCFTEISFALGGSRNLISPTVWDGNEKESARTYIVNQPLVPAPD